MFENVLLNRPAHWSLSSASCWHIVGLFGQIPGADHFFQSAFIIELTQTVC